MQCELCSIPLEETKERLRRLRKSKSKFIFCSVSHKNEALRLGMQGNEKFKILIPDHYFKTQIIKSKNKQINTNVSSRSTNKFKRHCKVCNNKLLARQKLFCSTTCCGLHKKMTSIEKWLNNELDNIGGTLPLSVRTFLLEECHYACSICRYDEGPLEIDHIDGNWRNHNRDNLRILCPNCHSRTPTWKNKNKPSEPSRYSFYRDKNWW